MIKSKVTAPRLLVVKNAKCEVTNLLIAVASRKIAVGTDMKKAMQVLLMLYYILDITYPRCFQLLCFLQHYVLKDDAECFQGNSLIKFRKLYEDIGNM